MLVYNAETDELGLLEGTLVRITDEGNVFKAYLSGMWETVGSL